MGKIQIELIDGQLAYREFLKLFMPSWFAIWGVCFLVPGATMTLTSPIWAESILEALGSLLFLVLVPVILIFHAFVFGSFVYLGYRIFNRFRKIEIIQKD